MNRYRKSRFKLQDFVLRNMISIKFMLMGPCIAILCQYMSNKMQLYTVYFICKLLHMFRVVSPPIIRSTINCIYSIWYWSTVVQYLPVSSPPQYRQVATTVDCRYSYNNNNNSNIY